MIHHTAIIESRVKLGKNVSVGPYTILRGDLAVGDDTVIDSHTLVEGRTTIGKGCRIGSFTAIGGAPQDMKYKGEDTEVIIGDECTIREFVTVNRGTGARMKTKIGSRVFLMSYVHIAHDCFIGDDVIMANCATLAGHVTVDDMAIVGGLTPVHQFVRVGKLSIIGGSSRITKDVVPFCKVAGNPAQVHGLNVIGLTRWGYEKSVKDRLKQAYKIVFRSGVNTSQALKKIESEVCFDCESVRDFSEFIGGSRRGICKN